MRGIRPGSTRLRVHIGRLLVAAGAVVGALGFALLPAGGQTDDSGTTATISKDGWWRPASPLPSTVPAAAIAVSAQGGNDDKVAAIGIDFHLSTEESLDSLKLTLVEDTTPGATYPPPDAPAQAQAQISACPITGIWVPEKAGDIAKKPAADCTTARADGVRNPDATWVFDLTSVAELWSSNAIEQNGVLLVKRVAAPVTFQISFKDLSTGTMRLQASTTFIESETTTTEDTIFTEDTTFTEDTSGDENFFTEIAESAEGSNTTPLGIVETTTTTTAAAREPSSNVPISNRNPTKGSLPAATFLLFPLALGLALVGGLVLGPAGDPAMSRRREGGLSRALDRRTQQQQEAL
jgi:hypothetical protein